MLSEIDPMYSKASVLKLDTSRVEAEKDILIFEITGSFLCSVHWIADLAVSSTTMRYEYSLGTCYIQCNLPNESNIFAPSRNNSLW